MNNPYNKDHRKVLIAVTFQEEPFVKGSGAAPILEITDAIVNRINQWYRFGIAEIRMFEVIEK